MEREASRLSLASTASSASSSAGSASSASSGVEPGTSATSATGATSSASGVVSPSASCALSSSVHAGRSLARMHACLQAEQLCDVVLVAGGSRFPAHRLVLSAASEYFAAMFTGTLRESQQSEITLENVDVDALQALIPYCYTGTIELHEDTVENILSAACLLQLNTVINACCNFLQKQLDPSNCLGIAMFAERQSCVSLQQQASEYTRQNFMEVYKNQEFLSLDNEQLALLLKSDDLNVTSEESVFESVMTWVLHNRVDREKSLRRLLELVKLPLLSPSFLFDQVEVSCASITECQPLIMEALKWHLLPERRPQLCSDRTNPRKSTMCKMLAVGGMDANKGTTSIEMYDPCTNTWSQFMKMGVRRSQFGVVIIKDKLILVGGRDGLRTLNIVDCVDLKTMTTAALSPLQTQRHGLGVAVMGDGENAPVYAVGGHDGWSYINTVERWDPVSRSWSYVAPMISQRSTCGVGVLEGRLYAVGGRDGSACLRTVESYCPHTNKWKQCASMVKKRGGVGVGVVGGYIYALGGHDVPAKHSAATMFSCVERYDPVANVWTLIANLPCGRDGIGTCILGDKLVAVGGYDGTEYLKNVEQYDAQSKEWRPLARLNIGRAGACVVPMPLWIRKRKIAEA